MINKLFKQFVSNNYFFKTDHPDFRRVYLNNIILLSMILITLFLIIINILIFSLYTIALVELVGFFIFIGILIYFHKTNKIEITAIITVIIMMCLLMGYIHIMKNSSYALYWVVIVPLIAYFLLGRKKGGILTILFFLYFFTFIILNYKSWEPEKFIFDSIVNIVIGSVGIILLVSYYEYSRNEAQQNLTKANKSLCETNEEINQQNEEIKAQADNLEHANYQITTQKQEIEKVHKNLTDSILYAKRIQTAVLPNDDVLNLLLTNYFVLFMPRDVVSGDFYYIKPYKNHLFIAAADCTGHGVPGAFLSMLAITLINELIKNSEIENSAQLLNHFRVLLKNSLQQSGQQSEQRDGLDISFVTLNIETNILSFAGANSPLWIFRNNEFIELKGDRMPIGIYLKEKLFTNHEYTVQPNDILYLFSDGFYSQFKDITKETMKIKRFKELLTEIHLKNFKEQKIILENYFNQWKGIVKQTDDILVIGVKI